MITVSQIVPRHTKDRAELLVENFYLTTDHCLMLSGHCKKCGEEVNLMISLEDLALHCPISPVYTESDVTELHELGIKLPEDE
jgi:hypothetical protein